MREVPGWVYVAAVVVLTVYAQLVIRWQVPSGERGAETGLADLLRLFLNPWVLSAFAAAALAALAWMAALTRYELSTAYPFVALTFIVVVLAGPLLFDERLTPGKVGGAMLVVGGLVLAVR